ncbi:MAG TPA: DUF305 domain-containing protein [Chloroflexia bacterium]|nr:DUF305 domain-containing protein [Chloroflexia bacterium]
MLRMERSFVSGVLAAALVLALGGVFAGAAAAQTQSEIDSLKGLSGQEFEVEWMNMMIVHHRGAVDMAHMVNERAAHQEIKDIAQSIISAQDLEITTLTGWLQQWYNLTPESGVAHEDMGMTAMLQNATGDEFDKLFLQAMHDHHRDAIAMAELVPDRATHEELKTLAQTIHTVQEAEIQQFMSWAQAWYGLDLMAPAAQATPMPMPEAGTTTGDMGDMGGATTTQPVGMPRTGGADLAFPLAALLAGLAALTVAGGIWVRRRA